MSPISSFDLGFRLSVAAVAGLVLLARLGTAWIEPALPRPFRGVAEPVSLTLAATVATLPIIVPTFQMLSLVSPVANILCGPLVSVVLLAGLAGLAAAAVWPALGTVVLGFAGADGRHRGIGCRVARLMAARVDTAGVLGDRRPCARVRGDCVGLGGVADADSRAIARACRALVVGTLLLGVGPRVSSGPTIEVLDVGQGDAILVRDGGRALLDRHRSICQRCFGPRSREPEFDRWMVS